MRISAAHRCDLEATPLLTVSGSGTRSTTQSAAPAARHRILLQDRDPAGCCPPLLGSPRRGAVRPHATWASLGLCPSRLCTWGAREAAGEAEAPWQPRAALFDGTEHRARCGVLQASGSAIPHRRPLQARGLCATLRAGVCPFLLFLDVSGCLVSPKAMSTPYPTKPVTVTLFRNNRVFAEVAEVR